MNLFLNGNAVKAEQGVTLDAFLCSHDLKRAGIAVAVNDAVVPRSRWEFSVLNESDRVLVIEVAQGG
ncbi:MAG: sulfur carrier protein ThiS [Fibrobacter sp.]|jgi:sulfur carrier protein|nr:sulfur carrier protein ThiS [Fibrobacter sp.]